MKRFIALTAVSLATLAGAASATTATDEIRSYAPNADLSSLSATEIAVLTDFIHGGDSEGEKRAKVLAYLAR